MQVDLTNAAGFPLTLDTETGELGGGGALRFSRVPRRLADLQPVLFEADGGTPDTEAYWTFPLLDAGPAAPTLDERDLTFSCVLLPPLKIGREFVKTQGHYHPPMPESDVPYPEVYTHLWGEPSLLLQRRLDDRPDRIDDCVLVELHAGDTITIPPGYAHILINRSSRPAAIAGLYSRAFAPTYDPVIRVAGAAYYLIDDAAAPVIPNPRYTDHPPLRRLTDLTGTRFAPPDPGWALWTSFLADPPRYDFLSDPTAARRRFARETGS
ncbi:MAG: glucose-6-phosphate isomerase family protein [Thermomicrobiales bacterium]